MTAIFWPASVPPLDFAERDWVLIADFENEAGGTIADGTVEYALAHALGESRFVNVVPRDRVVDTLRLMRRPPETAIDVALAREISQRDGGIRAVLAGRVDELQTTVALTAGIVDPTTGVTVASVREEAVGERAFLPAVQRLSNRVRAQLSEALADIEASATPLEKVTTLSLPILELFSEADSLIAQGKSNDAEGLLRQAVAEDPDFASGYMHLAHAIRNQERPAEEYLPYAERAVELSETTSDRERYFIRGGYYTMAGQLEDAATAYEALLRLYPDHYYGTNNLAQLYRRLGRVEQRARLQVRRADLRPNDLRVNSAAARSLMAAGDLEAAGPYLRRVEVLASADGAVPHLVSQANSLLVRAARAHVQAGQLEEAEAYVRRADALASLKGADPMAVARASFLPVYTSWRQGHIEQARSTLDRLVASGPPPTAEARRRWVTYAAYNYLALGMIRAAEELATRIDPIGRRYDWLHLVAWARGDYEAARDHIQQLPHDMVESYRERRRPNLLNQATSACS